MSTPFETTELQLLKLSRHYASLSPSTPSLIPSPPFPSSEALSRPATQSWLAEQLLAAPRSSQKDLEGEAGAENDGIGAGAWKKVFWRRVVKGIEEGFELRRDRGESVEDEEVHESILEAMVGFLSAAPADGTPGVDLRTYYWGSLSARGQWNCVKMKEEHRMISGGTTGLRTWQACIALSNHVLADPSFLCESTSPIVELGAGAGLLSLLAARVSRRTVVSTDVDPSVLIQLEVNISLNGLKDLVQARELDWELSDSPAGLEELLRWETNSFGPGGRSQLVLGADIVYDPVLTSQLASTLAFLLRPSPSASSNPRAYIAGTIRNESTWSGFLDRCRDRGLRVDEVELFNKGEDGIVGAEGWEGEGEVRLVRIDCGE